MLLVYFVIRFLISPQPPLCFSTLVITICFLFSFSLSSQTPGVIRSGRDPQANTKSSWRHRYFNRQQRRSTYQVHTQCGGHSAVRCFNYTGTSLSVLPILCCNQTTDKLFFILAHLSNILELGYFIICINYFLFLFLSSRRKQGASFEHWIHKTTLLFCESDQKNMRSW